MVDKRLIREAKQHMGIFSGLVGIAIVSGGLIVLQAGYIAKVVDGVFIQGLNAAAVERWMAMLLLIMVLRSILTWLMEVTAHKFAAVIKKIMADRLLQSIIALGPLYTAGEQAGEQVNLLTEGIESLEPYFAKYLPSLCTAAVIPVIVLAAVAGLDIETGLLLLVTAPLIPIFMALIGRMAGQRNLRQWETLSKLNAHFLDVLQGLTTLKIFGKSYEQVQVIARMSRQFREITLDILKIAFLSALVLELTATLSTALVAVAVGLRLLYYQLTFYQAFFVLLLAPEFYLPLRQTGLNYHAGLSGVAAAEKIFSVLARTTAGQGDLRPDFSQGVKVEFKAVYFAYQKESRQALSAVSFVIKPGEKVAVVGASGSGKSTLAALLLGFAAPDKGDILINGISLSEIDREHWLRQLAVVPQLPHLFYGTVEENIKFGRKDAAEEAVKNAAKAAKAHDFISSLPQGYHTVIGEGGHALSGGEAKRLAIARAFLQEGEFLILDEATAGLDTYHEELVAEAIDRLMAEKTVLIIAHRLTTVRKADNILVFDKGQVAETGTHENLLQQQGKYQELVTVFQGGATCW